VMADEIWHPLRNRLIVSLIPGVSLSDLREMYPLSKVARCKLCIEGAVDRALFLFTADASYSDRETAVLRMTAGASGEALFVPENIFESISGQVEASKAVLEAVLELLKESMGGDRDLYGFALDWILCGVGSAGVSGGNAQGRGQRSVIGLSLLIARAHERDDRCGLGRAHRERVGAGHAGHDVDESIGLRRGEADVLLSPRSSAELRAPRRGLTAGTLGICDRSSSGHHRAAHFCTMPDASMTRHDTSSTCRAHPWR